MPRTQSVESEFSPRYVGIDSVSCAWRGFPLALRLPDARSFHVLREGRRCNLQEDAAHASALWLTSLASADLVGVFGFSSRLLVPVRCSRLRLRCGRREWVLPVA